MSERLTNVFYPIVSFAALIFAWHFSIKLFNVPDYILPTPTAVLQQLRYGYVDGEYWPHVAFTLRSTITGYLIGCISAVLVGAVLAEAPTIEKFVYPYIVALQSMPKVALAPLIIVWFGFGLASKVVMVALMCFFPLFVNTVIGIRQADPELIRMMRAFFSPRWMIFFRVKLFGAASHIFAGLQISIVLSLIGAVVSEFVASTKGVGWLIQASLANFNTAQMFAALISLIMFGLVGTKFLNVLHERCVFWDRKVSTSAIIET